MLIVTGYVRVPPADVAAFMADLSMLAASTWLRDGCPLYAAAVDDADAGRLLVVERWRNEAALAAHVRSDAVAEFARRWNGSMSSDIEKFEVLAGKPLIEG